MTKTLRDVMRVNIRQANSAHVNIVNISNADTSDDEGKAMLLALRMGEEIKTRDSAVRVIKRNIPKIGKANTESLRNLLHPEVYQMLIG